TGKMANDRSIARNPDWANSPPYRKYSVAAQGKIAPNTPLVRVFKPGASDKEGAWVMPESEIDGLSGEQIAEKWSLKYVPTQKVDVRADGLDSRVGIAGSNFGHRGGGTQVELLKKGAEFTNPRPISPGNNGGS